MRIRGTGQLIRLLPKSALAQDIQAFIIDREARGLSPRTIEFYADELCYWMAWQESQGVSDVQSTTAALVQHYLVALGERRKPGGIHAAYRAIRAFLSWFAEEYEPPGWTNPIRKVPPARAADMRLSPPCQPVL